MTSTPRWFTAHIPRQAPVSRHSLTFVIKPFDFVHLSIAPQVSTTFPNYEIHERYSPQPSFPVYPSSRSTTPNITGPTDSWRLHPLLTSPGPQADRWQASSDIPQANGFSGPNLNSIRSPMDTYPQPYNSSANHVSAYSYHMQPLHDHLASMNPQTHSPSMFDDISRLDPRSSSPYGHSSVPSHASHLSPPRNYSPPPVSPTSPEEPTIKKKRKRVDAAQLKVLNQTYNQTAFPSTEERIALAKILDMSARSVQIW